MITASPINRACGRRIRGGVYAETRLSEDGLPIEYFIVDPPVPIDISQLGLASVGVKLIESVANAQRSLISKPAAPACGGIHHVFDVVGQEFYPYPSDYVEETRRLGASRRLPANLDFSRLGPGSRLVLIHARAVIENFSAYPQPPQVQCPKGLAPHALSPLPEMCAGLWWHDLPDKPDESGRVLHRIEGGTQYRGYPRPADAANAKRSLISKPASPACDVVPSYRHGLFLSLPISNLAVIQGGEATERNYQAACVSGVPVYLEEE